MSRLPNIIEGAGGGGSGPDPHVPVEEDNTLQSKAVARIVDVLCEGEIEGITNSAAPEKSIYFNKTPLKDANGVWNFQGVTLSIKHGLPDQDYVSGFPSVENEIDVSTELTQLTGGIVKTVTDSNVDDVRITVSVPRLTEIEEDGDLIGGTVSINILIKPNGGSYTTVKTIFISGKCVAKYQRTYRITNLSQYGDAPWSIKVERNSADSTSSKIQDKTFWDTYTLITNEKMIYPHTSLVGVTLDSKQFGEKVPSRAYDIKGLKIKVPDNYTVATRSYSGEWSGTFKTEWCDNPAWVYYDLLTANRYGMNLDPDKVDKWALYTIAQYCDEYVDDGYGSTEPRYVCNVAITVKKEAIHVLNLMASVFRGMPLWASGAATVVQDCPKSASKLVTAANVVDGMFNYEGSSLKARHTVAKVTWNDINDFCRKQVECVEEADGILKYGWNTMDVYAYGTTSRGQANRVGRWILDSELNETETVRYNAGLDHADLLPGSIIDLSDPHYTGGVENRFSGRVVSSTSSTLTIDAPITIEFGKTYTLASVLPNGTIVESLDVINSIGSTSVLEIDPSFTTQPQNGAVWMVTVSDLAPRKFRVISNIETEPNKYEITALYYSASKFARVEENVYLDEIEESRIPVGAILPPTNLTSEEFQYYEGGAALYGIVLSWEHPYEPRKMYYDVQSRTDLYGVYVDRGTTSTNTYDIRPTTSGIYDYRVRTVAAGGYSTWCDLLDVAVTADNTLCSGVENLQVYGGGTTFSGVDCEIEWDVSGCHTFKEYRVDVSKTDDTHLRTEYSAQTKYKYDYQMNFDDNSGAPIRELKFKVYAKNIFDKLGASTTLVAENPAPSMAGLTPTLAQKYAGMSIDWSSIVPEDNDLLKFKVYGDSTSPPTTEIYQCDTETTFFHWWGLDVGTTYYIQIEPYDVFGVGVKSSIGNEEPVLIPDINVDLELTTSIEMSDSDNNSAETLTKLYDRNKTSDGVGYTVTGTNKYVEYKYAVEDLFDRVIIYTADANAHAFIAYSSNGTSWSYLSGEADHTLNNDGELVTASGISDAETDYWQLSSGTNIAIYPAMVAGRYMRLYLTGSYTTTIYELVFYREIVAEMAAIDNLAALSANCGTLTAGIIQSSTYGADKGILVDLDNDRVILGGSSAPVVDIDADAGTGTFKGEFTFESGTSGYSEITDKPTTLSGVNAAEGTKLDGIDEGADVTSANTSEDTSAVNGLASSKVSGWAHTSDTTKIDGGDIYTNTVTATQINVSSLSAINADMGTLTAGIARSSDSKFIIDFTNKHLKVYDGSSVLRVHLGYIP